MESRIITEEEQSIFKQFLKHEDYKKVCIQSGFKTSTVYSIVMRNAKINKRNSSVLDALNIAVYSKMKETRTQITKTLKRFERMEVIKNLKTNE